MLAPVLERALALVCVGKSAKDLGLTQLTQLVKDVKACSFYATAATHTATASASASASAGGNGTGSATNGNANGKGKKSQSKEASAAAAPADITLPTTPYTPASAQAIR